MIKFEKTFKDAAPANFDGVFDWDFLTPALGGTDNKIEFTDLDGIVERKGQFIVLETKNKGVPIPKGQQWMLERLIKMGKGKIVVLIIYGKTVEDIKESEAWVYDSDTDGVWKQVYEDGGSDQVYDSVAWWWDSVEGGA